MKLLSNKLRVVNNSSVEITELSVESFFRREIRLAPMDTLMDEIDFDFRRFPFARYEHGDPESYHGKITILVNGHESTSVPDPGPTVWKHSGTFELADGRQLRYHLTLHVRGRFADLALSFLDAFATNNWMSSISDSKLLTELAIPGTHDSSTFLVSMLYVNTQNQNFTDQLNSGVRFFDIRVGKTIKNYWHLYHGPVPLGDYDILRDQLTRFLADNPRETVVVSIKEDKASPSSKSNLEIFKFYMNRDTGLKWFTENRIPSLGEVRGKAVLLRCFSVQPQEQPLGIAASAGWNSNSTSTIDISPSNDQVLVIQDRYKTNDPAAKFQWGLNDLIRSFRFVNRNALYLNFFSGVGDVLGWFPIALATPGAIARGYEQWYWNCGLKTRYYDGVNDYLARELDYASTRASKPRGIIILDYPDSNDLPRRIIGLNNL